MRRLIGQVGGVVALLGMVVTASASATPEGVEAGLRRDAVVQAIEQVMPCVVNIATEQIVEYRDPFAELFREFYGPYYRRRPRETRYSLGSGVIIDEEGYVLTNMHVVQRASRVWVQLHDGREFEARPRIVGTARADVALLQLVTEGDEKFQAVKFAKDDDVLLGETVLALGNPFGLGGSVSRGIVSSKNRRPAKDNEPLDVSNWLQTDAAINPGSSGGPLINLNGELIGLNVAVYREGQGIGFAIPIKQVSEALSELYIPEVNNSLWLGARIRSGPYPLSLIGVQTESPAHEAGLREGDVILAVNGEQPRGFMDCTERIGASPEGRVDLKVRRGEQELSVEVRMKSLGQLVRQKTGLTLQPMTEELADTFGYRPGEGLLVADVEAGSPAAKVEFQPGYLVVGMGGQATPDLLTAAAVLTAMSSGDSVDVTLSAWRRFGSFPPRRIQGTVTLELR